MEKRGIGMIREPQLLLDYITIKTYQFEQMVSFCHQVIGMDELNYEDNMVYLGIRRRKKPLVALIEAEEGEIETHRLNKVAFRMRDYQSFVELFSHLNNTNQIVHVDDYGFMHSFFIQDPDGNCLEFYIEMESKEWMPSYPEPQSIYYSADAPTEVNYHLNEDTVLGNVGLAGHSMDEMTQFYHHVLSLEDQSTSNKGEHHFAPSVSNAVDTMICATETEGLNDHNEIDFIVFQVMTMDQLRQLKEQLESHHYSFYYNEGKKIIAIDDPYQTSFWLQVRGNANV